MPPASKVSRRLAERIAPELVEHIYRARLAGELIASFPLLSALNEAHLVMLARCGIETPDVGGALAVTLLRVAEEGPAPFGIGRPAARYTLLIDAAATLRRAMPDRAELFAMVVMPGHTRLQPAQPITFGYYLWGIASTLERDAALATTAFPIDRALVARLLGFDGVLEHGLDCVAYCGGRAACSHAVAPR